MHIISAIELNSLLQSDDKKPLLLDVREPNEYEYCHIDNSMLMPMQSIPNQLDQLPKDEMIVTICHHGMRSQQVAQFLLDNGFSHVTNLSGGVHAWATSVDNDMPTY
ncbi:MAG: rhodanese [Cycloclasticus sp.]|nr:rhodanese [Cycloclasticus sp.]